MKEFCLYSLDLTTKNNLSSGFLKRHEDVTKGDIQRALKAALESLRRKAKLRHWSYIIYAAISNVHQSQGGITGSWHAHVLIYGTPCRTITAELKSYWTKHHYGNAVQSPYQKCYSGGKVAYVRIQEKAGLFQKVNAASILEQLGLHQKASKAEILRAWRNIGAETQRSDTTIDTPNYSSIALLDTTPIDF